MSTLTLWALSCSESHEAIRSSSASEENNRGRDASDAEVDDRLPEDPRFCGLVRLAEVSGEFRGPLAMAQDEERLYFEMPKDRAGQETESWSVSKTGGTLALESGAPPAFPLPQEAEVAGIRYGLSADQRAITRDAGAGEAESIALLPADMVEECLAIGADETSLYFTSEGGEMWRVAAVPGAASERLFVTGRTDCDDDYNGLMVAVDQTYVYWLGGDPSSDDKTSDGEPLGLFRACK